MTAAETWLGRIDVVVNNAAIDHLVVTGQDRCRCRCQRQR
jgi:hypothetical protein